MNKLLAITLFCLLLPACVTLPGSEAGTTSRYLLKGPVGECETGATPLALSIVRVNAGLDTSRIARRDAHSGEYSYLKNVRWVEEVAAMMEQRLATDLECRGYTVLTSHHSKLSYDRLVCEVRALNLVEGDGDRVEDRGGDRAEVGLSCVYFRAGAKKDIAIRSHHSSDLRSWSANDAVAAASDAYQRVFSELADALP